MSFKHLAIAAIAFIASPAAATVVTFDGLGFIYNETLSTGGIKFVASGAAQYFYPDSAGGAYDPAGHFMYAWGDTTLSRMDNSAFKLDSIKLGNWSFGNTTLNYTLNLAAGGTQDGSVALTSAFQTISFGQTVTSVLFKNANTYIVFNDLTYSDAVADVPEPAMLGLFGLGAIGVGLSRRKRKA